MRLDIHIHACDEEELHARLRSLEVKISQLISKQEIFMASTKQDFDSLREAMDNETNRLAAKMQELIDKVATGGMTEAEEADVLAQFTAVKDRLASLGADPAEPIPPIS